MPKGSCWIPAGAVWYPSFSAVRAFLFHIHQSGDNYMIPKIHSTYLIPADETPEHLQVDGLVSP